MDIQKRRTLLQTKMYKTQMESAIHHSFLQLAKYDPELIGTVYEGLLKLDLVRYRIDVEGIRNQALEEVSAGKYEEILSSMGGDTMGSYTIVSVMEQYVEILDSINRK